MFTGIVTDIGRVTEVAPIPGGLRLRIATALDLGDLQTGASIACSGACLTAVEHGPDWFAADVSAETLARTTIGRWRPGSRINLERSLKLGDELGGHIVSGHVDGLARLVERWRFEVPPGLERLIAEKGSIALDGVSLTVNGVEGRRFWVTIIPHTEAVTTLGALNPGDEVNLEIDMLARYVARLTETAPAR